MRAGSINGPPDRHTTAIRTGSCSQYRSLAVGELRAGVKGCADWIGAIRPNRALPNFFEPKSGLVVTVPLVDGASSMRRRMTRWWARQDSNLQPDRYERSALTIELQALRPHSPRRPAGAICVPSAICVAVGAPIRPPPSYRYPPDRPQPRPRPDRPRLGSPWSQQERRNGRCRHGVRVRRSSTSR